MNAETQVSPAAETQNPAAELTQSEEVVTPETEQAATSQTSEKDERDKAIARMERRINRKHAEAAEARAENALLREQLEKAKSAPETPQKVEVDRDELNRVVLTKAQEIAKAKEFVDQCNAISAKGRKQFEDFDAKVSAMSVELPIFRQDGTPTETLRTILEADDPAAVMHYLGKHPDIAAELSDLTPTQLARRLDRIERDMKTTRSPSSAPRPLEPERASAAPGIPDPDKDPQGWIAWRNKTAKR